jgi:hypothetical protein
MFRYWREEGWDLHSIKFRIKKAGPALSMTLKVLVSIVPSWKPIIVNS